MIFSICIPTFNRKKELEKQLNIFFKQVKNLKYKYSLVVSDNGSNDGTKKTLLKYKKKFSKLTNVNFQLNANKKNIGFTKNLLKTLKISSGDYTMILADDDFPSRKFYKKIYEYLEKHRPKGILFVPLFKEHLSKNLNNRPLYFKILSRLKKTFLEFSYVNQRSGSMSGIILRTKSIFLEKQFSGNNTLYPQIHISLNYYLKYGFHPIKFNESINMTTQKGGIIHQVKDSMNRPKDYSVLERFKIVDFYKKKKLISKSTYFGALTEIYYWFYDLKFQVKYLYKNIKIFNQFNDAIQPQIKDRFLFYIISFILIILPIKMSKNFYEMKKFILKEILSFYKYKIK